MYREEILFYVQILSLIFLIIYVVKTWEMASATRKAAEATEKSVIEMRETRDQETAPFIVAYFEIPKDSSYIYLVVKNIGRTVATHVKLNFTPELRNSNSSGRLREVGFIKDGIEAMPPNYEVRTLLDTGPAYYGNEELPLKYSVEIKYYGGLENKQRIINQPLDLLANKGRSYIREKNMGNLVDEVKKIAKEYRETSNATKKIAKNLERGILISNTSLSIKRLEPDMKNWKKRTIAQLREFEILWAVISDEQRINGINLDGLQAKILHISKHISELMLIKQLAHQTI